MKKREIDPNKTTLNEFLGAYHNQLGHLVSPTRTIDGHELGILTQGPGEPNFLCWKENGSIYLEDKPK